MGHARSRPPSLPSLHRYVFTFAYRGVSRSSALFSRLSVREGEKERFSSLSREGKRKSERERSLSWSEEGRNFPSSKDFPDYASDNYFSIRGGEMSRIKTRPVVE